MSYSRNGYLSEAEMTENATEIVNFFVGVKGWTLNSVCGMLGNMEHESTINPGIFENLDYGNLQWGVGLVQWTPARILLEWAQGLGRGDEWLSLRLQMDRIQYEVENGIQYYSDRTFRAFTQSTEPPEDLAKDFLLHYERPAVTNQPWRWASARKWFNYFKGDYEPPEGEEPEPFTTHYPFDIFYYITSDYGWRDIWPFFHPALDFGAPCGEKVHAMHGGIVTVPPYDARGYGNYVIVEGGNFRTFYAHLSQVGVSTGQEIKGGHIVGLVGTTGNSTGCHLHLELWINGKHANPRDYIDVNNGTGKVIEGLTDGQETYIKPPPELEPKTRRAIDKYLLYNRYDRYLQDGDHHEIARNLY